MERPYVICHMLSSIDGKVTGEFLSSKNASKGIEEYYCGKEVAIKYNINYSTFKSTLSRYGQIVINDMIYKWN